MKLFRSSALYRGVLNVVATCGCINGA
jgi:hypothetical protein